MTHCWADYFDTHPLARELGERPMTCLLPDGHDGPHAWTPDEEIVVEFPADGPALEEVVEILPE